MSLQDYLSHYLVWGEILKFLAIALVALVACLTFIILAALFLSSHVKKKKRAKFFYMKSVDLIERFYEMIFSGASILSFLATYYLIDRFVTEGAFRVFWDKHSDMLLLLLIVMSCLINTLLDKFFVPLRNLNREKKASVRMIGMLYIILIFVYIKFIYENNNYDGFITYFLGLMVGRFVYFDASFKDFLVSIRNAAKNLPLLVLGLSYTGLMCFIGFGSKYLLISNGVLVSTFIAHIFMVVAIFIIFRSKVIKLVIKNPDSVKKSKKRQDDGYEEYDEYDAYDEYDEYDDERNDESYLY